MAEIGDDVEIGGGHVVVLSQELSDSVDSTTEASTILAAGSFNAGDRPLVVQATCDFAEAPPLTAALTSPLDHTADPPVSCS